MEKDAFKMPKAVTIKGRSSSITNSFFNGIVPVVAPTDKEIKKALDVLEQDENDVRCVYCGAKKTEWDHLHPLIVNKKHTGYITEIANLVPACGKCNQSKGNSDWKKWMRGDASLSPKSKGVQDLDHRIAIIENYDKTFKKTIIDLAEIIGKDKWEEYETSLKKLEEDMKNVQCIMDKIKKNYLSTLYIKIRDVSFRTIPAKNETIQNFIKFTLEKLFENNLIPETEIEKLKTLDYSKQCFDIDFPLLQVELNEHNRVRYWKDKINNYYVCSQWYQKKHDDKLKKWILHIGNL